MLHGSVNPIMTCKERRRHSRRNRHTDTAGYVEAMRKNDTTTGRLPGKKLAVPSTLVGGRLSLLFAATLLLVGLGAPDSLRAASQADTADVFVLKSGPSAVGEGETVVFVIEVGNRGPAAARNIVVADLLPSELRFVSASRDGSWANREVTWEIPLLAVGEEQEFRVTAVASGRTNGRVTAVNTATVSSDAVDPVASNNASAAGVLIEGVAGTPDVEVYKSAPDSVGGGDRFTYTIEVANIGDRYTEGVVLTDVLPPGVTVVEVSPEAENQDGVLTWPGITELRPGESKTYTVTVDAPPSPDTLTNRATVTSIDLFGDANSENNNSSAVTRVLDPQLFSDVTIEKTGPASVVSGAVVTYTLRVTNAGLGAASDVLVTDMLPTNGRFLNAVPEPSDTAGGLVSWASVPALGPNDVLTYTVELEAPTGPDTLFNVATVTSADPDGDPSNNRSSLMTTVSSVPPQGADLSVTNAPDGRVHLIEVPGESVFDTLRIVVTNQGPGLASSVILVDTLALGFNFQPQDITASRGEVVERVVTWRIGDLPPDSSVSFGIPVSFDTDGIYYNVAHVASTSPDPNQANNSDSSFVIVNEVSPEFLNISKTASRPQIGVGETVRYEVRVYWQGGARPEEVTLTDLLPRGFTYVSGTAHLNGTPLPDTARDQVGALLFPLGVLGLTDTAVVVYRGLATADALSGDGINRARASTATLDSNEATAQVRVLPGAFTDEGIILGTVYTVRPGELLEAVRGRSIGIPGVRVFLQNGRFTHTDADGRYSFEGLSPRTWVVRVDEMTLPAGSQLFPITNRHAGRGSSAFVDLKDGELHRADFAEVSYEDSVRVKIEALRAAPTSPTTHTGPGYDVRTGDASRGPYQGLAPVTPAWDWERSLRYSFEPEPEQIETEILESAARDSADAPKVVGGSLPEMIAVGVVEARLDLRSLLNGELSGLTERNRFEDALVTYSTSSDDGKQEAGARASLFADGEVGLGNRLTLRIDSEEDRRARFFNDIRPEQGYPLFGDGSSSGYSAQSKGRIFGRWSRGASFGQFGDFSTASGAYGAAGARSLGEYSRTLNGWLQRYESQRVRVDAFASRDRASQVIDEFPGRGISGPYPLSRAEGLLNSETVELVTRDRNQPGVVLSTARLQRYADYTMEPFSGRIIFKRPIPPTDENFNPVSIRVQYEVDSGAEKYWVAGANAQALLGNRLEVGGGIVRDDNPLGRFDLSSVNATLDLGRGTTFTSEYARADSASMAAGGAVRFELRHGSDRFNTRLLFLQTDSLFVNPSSSFLAARREFSFLGSARLADRTSLFGEALRTEERRTGD